MVQVEVKENLWNRTAGLCGRFDGDFNNDMLTKDGSHPKSVVTLATSWQVDTLGESCNSVPSEEHVCVDAKVKGTKGTRAMQFCKKILSDKRFAPCRSVSQHPSIILFSWPQQTFWIHVDNGYFAAFGHVPMGLLRLQRCRSHDLRLQHVECLRQGMHT